jgi:hypothetical protein
VYFTLHTHLHYYTRTLLHAQPISTFLVHDVHDCCTYVLEATPTNSYSGIVSGKRLLHSTNGAALVGPSITLGEMPACRIWSSAVAVSPLRSLLP